MSVLLDKFINLFKWPVALLMLIFLPAICYSFQFFMIINKSNLLLFGGIVFFVFSKTMMDPSVRTSMQVIAHEFAHVFFAVLTFHKIKHIRIHPDDTGGEMGFFGHGNWLIVIAPYFFPLFCLILMCVLHFTSVGFLGHFILGYFLAYHIDTVCSQIHPEQTDLKKVGYKFCFVFLPSVNLLTIGSILAYNLEKWNGVIKYFSGVYKLNMHYMYQIINLISDKITSLS